MKYMLLLLTALTLTACERTVPEELHNRIVWNKDGCAYSVRADTNNGTLRRLPDSDYPTCARKKNP